MIKLSKTDLVLKDEQDKILENRLKLNIGEKYTYKKITQVLEIRYLNGKAKSGQVMRIREYIDWDENFIIRDNRLKINKLNGGGSKGTKSRYIEYSKGIIAYKLASIYSAKHDKEKIMLSKSKAIELMELFSDSYKLAVKSDNEVVAEALTLETKQVKSYMSFIKGKAVDIFESTCKNLEKGDIIVLRNEMIIIQAHYIPIYDNVGKIIIENKRVLGNRCADDKEIEVIKSVEKTVLQEMGIKNQFQAGLFGRYDEFKKRVCKKLGFEAYWKAYDIYPNPDEVDEIVQAYEGIQDELVQKLKMEFVQSIMESNAKVLELESFNNKELLEKLSKICVFGDSNFDMRIKAIVERNKQIALGKQRENTSQQHKLNEVVVDEINTQEKDELKELLKEVYNIDVDDSEAWIRDDELEMQYLEENYEHTYIEEVVEEKIYEQCPYREKYETVWEVEKTISRKCLYYEKWEKEEKDMGLFTDVFDPSGCPHLEKQEELGLQVEEYKQKCPYITKKDKKDDWESERYKNEMHQYIINEFSSEFEE